MRILFFSRTDPFEVAFFRMGKWILGFLGFWPSDHLNRSTLVVVLINLSILLTAIVGEIRLTWLIRRQTIEALAAICPCLTKIVTWMKLICFLFYRKEFAKLLKDLYEHLYEDTKDTRKNGLIARVSFFTATWYMVLYFFGISTNCFYNTKPFIVWTYRRLGGDYDSWVTLPFQAALPYKDMTQVQSKTIYSFVYCLLAYSGTVTIFGFPGVDGTFMSFCMYLSVSYRCLQEDFKQAFRTHVCRNMTSSDWLYNELSVLVKRQQRIIEMFTRFNRVYKFMVFCHFLFAGIVLGVALIDFKLTPGISKTIYMTYAMGACSQLYTYCYGAASVNKECSRLGETLYFCDWYECDTRVKKLVLFVMVKSQRGSLLRAPFFSPSLPLLATIMKTSASYFTLLEAFL